MKLFRDLKDKIKGVYIKNPRSMEELRTLPEQLAKEINRMIDDMYAQDIDPYDDARRKIEIKQSGDGFHISIRPKTDSEYAESIARENDHVDIHAEFNGERIGTIQGISYHMTREMAPVYTLGSQDPRSFARGKRSIAGTITRLRLNKIDIRSLFLSRDDRNGINKQDFDMVPPFDVVLTVKDKETGEIARMKFIGCEIMSQGYGTSIYDFVNNEYHENVTYLAREMEPWVLGKAKEETVDPERKILEDNDGMIINPFTGKKSWL